MKTRSHLHCEWLSEMELCNERRNGKAKLTRFKRLHINYKNLHENYRALEEESDNPLPFDENIIKVDRVLNCTELFAVVHPRQAVLLKGKWQELCVKVVQHLVN